MFLDGMLQPLATIDEISLTPIPSNPRALVTVRRDVAPWDVSASYDDILAAAQRAQRVLEALMAAPLQVSHDADPVLRSTDPASRDTERPEMTIAAGAAFVIGTLPRAALSRKRTPFAQLVCGMEQRNHHVD